MPRQGAWALGCRHWRDARGFKQMLDLHLLDHSKWEGAHISGYCCDLGRLRQVLSGPLQSLETYCCWQYEHVQSPSAALPNMSWMIQHGSLLFSALVNCNHSHIQPQSPAGTLGVFCSVFVNVIVFRVVLSCSPGVQLSMIKVSHSLSSYYLMSSSQEGYR